MICVYTYTLFVYIYIHIFIYLFTYYIIFHALYVYIYIYIIYSLFLCICIYMHVERCGLKKGNSQEWLVACNKDQHPWVSWPASKPMWDVARSVVCQLVWGFDPQEWTVLWFIKFIYNNYCIANHHFYWCYFTVINLSISTISTSTAIANDHFPQPSGTHRPLLGDDSEDARWPV